MEPITRRDALKGAASLAIGAGVVGTAGRAGAAPRRERIAIVGAGAGGIAAAHFLAGTHHVELFEARGRIGGHCDSRTVEHRGERVTVDLGAQFFHPDTHPIYVTLLEEIGLYDPEHREADETLESPASLCVFPVGGGPPVLSSTNPRSTLPQALQFAQFTRLAREAVLTGLPYGIGVGTWIGGLPLEQAFKDDVLAPWITATIGSSRADAMRSSARAILQTFALAFPADLTRPASTFTSRIGLQGNLQRLLDRSAEVEVHLRAPARGLERKRGRWFVRTPHGRRGPFDHVVLNAPPRIGRKLLRPLPAFAEAAELLGAYRYFDSRLVIHADPAYMQADRANWAAYNAGVDGRRCEGSAWLGALHEPLPGGGTVDVFKSWATRRGADPAAILLERRFKHPLIGRASIRAARRLRRHQGRGGLHFSGHYTTGMDLQESAVYSAMQVARALAPRSATLAALDERLAARGRGGISYDL
ncbi:MAG: FAD-dependent oxidoreductase [Solirubrobacteraceae bacterium]